jgi:NDP-sugar pyrophosphorylase family protein
MKAMILAAGLGTRLKPFTLKHPKALFEIDGQPLLKHAIDHLKNNGIFEIVVNVHHFADQIINFIDENQGFGCDIVFSDETGELLETGGGLKKAAWFFDREQDFIVRNVDILSNLDLNALTLYHRQRQSMVTLAVRNRQTNRYFLFNDTMKLCGWKNIKTGEIKQVANQCLTTGFYNYDNEPAKLIQMAFSGIQVVNSAIFPLIIETGAFSLTQLYLRLAAENPVFGFQDNSEIWADIGTM